MLRIESWDERRNLFIGEDAKETVDFCVEHWIHSAQRAIQQRGRFAVALSGGSTPKAIFEKLTQNKEIDWSKVWLFWSDERAVPPNHPDSNYFLAMQSGFNKLPIPPSHIFRMQAENQIEKNAFDYEEKIRRHLGTHLFDLVMLGVGEDGHTASLFPKTTALEEREHLVASNYIDEKKGWRMTFTYPCINQSQSAAIYALGKNKEMIVPKVLEAAIVSPYPASGVGTPQHKALWVLDRDAARLLKPTCP